MSKKHNHVTRFKLPTLSRTKMCIKYAHHTLRDHYHKTSADVVLLIDAKNALKKLNASLKCQLKSKGQCHFKKL